MSSLSTFMIKDDEGRVIVEQLIEEGRLQLARPAGDGDAKPAAESPTTPITIETSSAVAAAVFKLVKDGAVVLIDDNTRLRAESYQLRAVNTRLSMCITGVKRVINQL
ncbi:hypothetical protein FOZ62_021295 [Perkinsus olseni]|uniref:Uncharacterized protein n=1 Tax=Perkinsus olseni TaxID=32597 RepID=A0A7J6SSH4_PEROL|nr:hypothetical protein FOZ62_021295 [Perkinsus olseni]